jgi:hypothetical protein
MIKRITRQLHVVCAAIVVLVACAPATSSNKAVTPSPAPVALTGLAATKTQLELDELEKAAGSKLKFSENPLFAKDVAASQLPSFSRTKRSADTAARCAAFPWRRAPGPPIFSASGSRRS